MSAVGVPPPQHKRSRTIDAKNVRLSILALLVIASFVALYSRLWYLQVLAVDELKAVAKDNRVRVIEYEPPRGRILDRWGNPLVENKQSLAVSLERDLLENPHKKRVVLARLAKELNVDLFEMYDLLDDTTVSPYRAIPVAYDIPEAKMRYIEENGEDFPGVVIEKVWRRKVVRGTIAPHVLGFTNEISDDELKDPEWKGYEPGDIIGKAGVERTYDAELRGKPRLERVVVDSTNDPIGKPRLLREAEPGLDVRLTIIPRIQRVAQSAIENGVMAARATGYQGRSGAAVVMDPNNGEVLALASYPTYDARILANGYTDRDARLLGVTTEDPSDDALTNRPIAAPLPPGSTFKPITAAAALELGASLADVKAALEAQAAAFGRVETIPIEGRDVSILLVKNPAGANEVLRTLTLESGRLDLWLALNDKIADGRDVSWIWDADFELLAGRVRRVTCSGTRAEEMALRLKYAGIQAELAVDRDIPGSLDAALAGDGPARPLYALPTYTALLELREVLARRGLARAWADQ